MKISTIIGTVLGLVRTGSTFAESMSFSFSYDTAFAVVGDYPEGPSDVVFGVVTVEESPTGGVVFSGSLEFLTDEYDGKSGGVHVHAGRSLGRISMYVRIIFVIILNRLFNIILRHNLLQRRRSLFSSLPLAWYRSDQQRWDSCWLILMLDRPCRHF